MTSEGPKGAAESTKEQTVHGSGSVAHSIIGTFVIELGKREGLADVAKRIEAVVYESPTEGDLRNAMFGDQVFAELL